ncbi:MAG: hypothetical protein ACI4DR_02635 [Roseburia sp.]
MKQIVSAFSMLMTLLLNLLLAVTILTVSAKGAEMKEYKAAVVAEIENSNFNTKVISTCIREAQNAGYQLEVKESRYDMHQDRRTAEVILKYTYELPLFHMRLERTARGIAR